MTTPDYWNMPDADLRKCWAGVSTENLHTDYDGAVAERLNMIEDAILQRIGAPDDASGDEPVWQERIRAYGEERTS